MIPEPAAPGGGAPDDDTLRSMRNGRSVGNGRSGRKAPVSTGRAANDPDASEPGGDATARDAGESTEDGTIRVRRSAGPTAAPREDADAHAGARAGMGGRVAFRPDARASGDPSPIRTPAPVVVARTERSPAEPQKPLDSGEVGHDIRSRARRRALTLVAVALAVMATAAALLVALVSGLG